MPRPMDVNTTVLRPANIEPPLTQLQKVQAQNREEIESELKLETFK